MQHVTLVSSPLPNGLSWLINCLLELGIRTTAYGSYWVDAPDGSRMHPVWVRHNQSWYLPVLHRQDRFHFRDDLEVFWTHQLRFAQYPTRKTILFVRDLRDSTYSLFRRQVASGFYQNTEQDLLTFLQQPETWPDLGNYQFYLPPADTLAYFNLCCFQQVPPGQLLVLRFEDCKRDPLGQLQRVMHFLEIHFSQEDLLRAISLSGSEQALKISEKMQSLTGTQQIASRGGLVEEWKTSLSARVLDCFRGPAELALQTFGYPALPATMAPMPEPTSELARIAPLLTQFQNLLAQGNKVQAEVLLQQSLNACSEPDLKMLLAGQWLALLWTRSLMPEAQIDLPAASRLAHLFSTLNAHFGHLPQLQRLAAEILNPAHLLRQHWPPHAVFTQAGFNAERPFGSKPVVGFAQAARQALASGHSFFLWQEAGLQLAETGLLQLCACLDGPLSDLAAAIPVLEPPLPDSDLPSRTRTLQIRWGAEFQRVPLQQLPPCILFLTSKLVALPLEAPPSEWLPDLTVHQALGVPAWRSSQS